MRMITSRNSLPFRTRGFALVLTLALLGLLVLVIAGLAVMTRTATRAADSGVKQTQARQNAMMGLNIALAQLQKHAGPDDRVTATAAHLQNAANPYFTGVWRTDVGGALPVTWLVSGNERSNPLTVTPETTRSGDVTLIPARSSSGGAAVTVPAVAIRAKDEFDPSRTVDIGQYAWWVGDQGVKASVALPDRFGAVNYAPWDTPLRSARLRQQIAGTPAFFRNSAEGKFGFDPFHAPLNAVKSPQQLAFLSMFGETPTSEQLRNRYHEFTDVTYGVLASTRSDEHRGLMRDLSVSPQNLGAVFETISNYAAYMERPDDFGAIGSADSVRRRYRISAPQSGETGAGMPQMRFSVVPVIAEFLLQFKFTRVSAGQVSVGCRLYVGLWNPYTSALVPPSDLELEIRGLPQVLIASGSGSANFDLGANLPPAVGSGSVIRVRLPFDAQSAPADRASWLPGRLYGWVTPTGTPTDNRLTFYNKNLNASGWIYPTNAAVPGNASDTTLGVSGPAVSDLVVSLRDSSGVLATYTAPRYQSISQSPTTTQWKFAFAFRSRQPSSLELERDWLQLADPRHDLGPAALRPFDPNEGENPNPNVFMTSGAPVTAQYLNQFLVFRSYGATATSLSASNDVTLFELPRAPFLSIGELQHVQFVGQRPFAVGNPWGGTLNSLFDRFFFSGLRPEVGEMNPLSSPLPNPNLVPVDSRPDPDTHFSLQVLRDGDSGLTAKHLLQAGAFNVNSLNRAAWHAVLSAVRFPEHSPFVRIRLESNASSPHFGSQASTTPNTAEENFDSDPVLGSTDTGNPLSGAAFFRFPQSAQETFDWANAANDHAQVLTTEAYRLGVRGRSANPPAGTLHHLTADQIDALAKKIVELNSSRMAAQGPFRSMEAFLSPNGAYGGRSLIEHAIATADETADQQVIAPINPAEISPYGVSNAAHFGFSSLTLTQADIMTALAPYLRPRSDTFIIRAYGSVVNPVTTEVEAAAWVEATVQRMPEPLIASDDPVTPASGRRFKVISLRWLSSSDL